MKNLRETDEKTFLLENAAEAFFENVCTSDIWRRVYTKELQAFAIDDAPMFIEDIKDKYKIANEVTNDSITENMNSLNMGLSVPFDNGYVGYPLGDSAFGSLVQRAGYKDSPVILSLGDKASQVRMHHEDKAQILNMGLSCFKNQALVLIRDEKVRAVLSGDESDYSSLPFNELYKALKDGLNTDFKEVAFKMASASHYRFTCFFQFTDKAIIKSLGNIFSGKLTNITLGVALSSSDVGVSGANLYPYVCSREKTLMIGSPLSLTHKNRATVADFAVNVGKILSMFKDAEQRLDNLSKEKVKNVQGCLLRCAKQIGLPKKASCDAAPILESTYGSACTQADIYWQLYDILDKYAADNAITIERKLLLEEGICRVAFNMSDYDLPFQWE